MSIEMMVFFGVLGVVLLVVAYFAYRELRVVIDDDYVRVNVVHPGKYVRKALVKKTPDRPYPTFRLKDDRTAYQVPDDHIYRTGLFHSPTLYYQYGKRMPIMLETGKSEKEDAFDLKTAQTNQVTAQLLDAFKQQIMSPDMMFILTLLAIGGAAALLWYTGDQQHQQLMELLRQSRSLNQGGN